jgi:hypothetical protein
MLDRAQTARPGPSELFVGFGCGAQGCGTGSALVTRDGIGIDAIR